MKSNHFRRTFAHSFKGSQLKMHLKSLCTKNVWLDIFTTSKETIQVEKKNKNNIIGLPFFVLVVLKGHMENRKPLQSIDTLASTASIDQTVRRIIVDNILVVGSS